MDIGAILILDKISLPKKTDTPHVRCARSLLSGAGDNENEKGLFAV